jgi:hypothetical protein
MKDFQNECNECKEEISAMTLSSIEASLLAGRNPKS